MMDCDDDRDRASGERPATEAKTPPLVALDTFFQQLGRVMVRVAELETAIEMRDTVSVLDGMRVLAPEWSLLNADLLFLQAFTPPASEVVTLPAMQIARDHARKALRQCMVYAPLVTSAETSNVELMTGLYMLAAAFARDASARTTHPEASHDTPHAHDDREHRVASVRAQGSCVSSVTRRSSSDRLLARPRHGARHGRTR